MYVANRLIKMNVKCKFNKFQFKKKENKINSKNQSLLTIVKWSKKRSFLLVSGLILKTRKKVCKWKKKAHFMIEYTLFYRVQAQIDTVKCNVHTIKKQDHQAQLEAYWNIFFFLKFFKNCIVNFKFGNLVPVWRKISMLEALLEMVMFWYCVFFFFFLT